MLFGDYQFIFHVKQDALLPPYKGSTLRGFFGASLKKLVCVLRRSECKECLLKDKCLFAISFETNEMPPFVIEPPLEEKTLYKEGDTIDFHLLLFGEINKALPYIIYALRRGENIPIGKSINGKKGFIKLKEVRKENQLIYSEDLKKIDMKDLSELKLPDLSGKEQKISKIRIHLITPLRMKFQNRLYDDLPFSVLIRAILRRITYVFSNYGEKPEISYEELLKKSETIKQSEKDIRWIDLKRYSFRQKSKMLLGGIIGNVTYEGDLAEFIPLIMVAEKLHIGKQTSFGFGKIKMEIL